MLYEFWYYYDVVTTRLMTGGIAAYVVYRVISWVF